MRILVTGGCGFVGSNIAVFLKKKIFLLARLIIFLEMDLY